MAVASKTETIIQDEENCKLFTWNLTSANNIGAAISHPQYREVCFQVNGDFDGAAVVTIQGSNVDDDSLYVATQELDGNANTFSAAGLKSVLERPRFLRPAALVNPANMDLTVTAFLLKQAKVQR